MLIKIIVLNLCLNYLFRANYFMINRKNIYRMGNDCFSKSIDSEYGII